VSSVFRKLRNAIEMIVLYAVGLFLLPLGFLMWLEQRKMRKLLGDDWLSGGEPSGRWDKKE
jgi:hypothetical protein